MNVVIQVNNAKIDRAPMTLAARKLAERSAQAEADYAAGKISPAYLLRLVARHYDDDATLAALDSASATPVEGAAAAPPEENASQSLLASQPTQDEEDDDPDDDLVDDFDPRPEDDADDTWLMSDEWDEPAAVEDQVIPEAVDGPSGPTLADFSPEEMLEHLTVEQRVASLRSKDVNDFVGITCQYCYGKVDTLYVTECEHALCSACLMSLEEKHIPGEPMPLRTCPECRAPIRSSKTYRVKASSLCMAWKADLDSGFNTSHIAPNRDLDGRRPADEAWQRQQERDDAEYARLIQGD